MKHFIRYILSAAVLFGLTSCLIENDISYPEKDAVITVFEVEGQKSVTIDAERRRVEIVLNELADMSAVKIDTIGFNEGVSLVGPVPEILDLTEPVTLTLKAYEEFEWVVTATQPIDRYIRVTNQVGDATFDLDTKTAFVYVTEYQQLKYVEFLDMKLEPEGSEIVSTTGFSFEDGESRKETLDCDFPATPMILECVMLRTFLVEYDGGEICWTVRVQKKKVGLQVTSINAFAGRVEIKAGYDGQGAPVIEYKKVTDTEWTEFTGSAVAGAGLSGVITGLEPDTDYLVRVANNGNYSNEVAFTTEAEEQLYNMDFEDWWENGKIWYPYKEEFYNETNCEKSIWDSANKGAATFIGSSTTPEENGYVGKAVRMESKDASIAFAAGNIYTGKFAKLAGIGAELDWGVPFKSRPTSLKGYYSYVPKKIDKADAAKLSAGNYNADEILGSMDKCQIQVILADWDAPFHVNTKLSQFVDVKNDPHIIAYAKLESDEATDGYQEFVLDLEYRDTTRKPTYVVISACASYLGDYFTGAVGSTMYIDQFEFVY